MGDRIALGSDHRGYPLKRELVRRLAEAGFEVNDVGPGSDAPVDYPDFAAPAARAVSEGSAERAIVICGSGLGVMYTANRFPRVRAALVHDAPSAALARQHNDANVLALSGDRSDPETAWQIVRTWLETPFEGGRHIARVAKIDALTRPPEEALHSLAVADPEMRRLVRREAARQARELDLRPLANFASQAVLEALGSVLAHRSGTFGASPLASEAESLARERAVALFCAAGAEVRVGSLFDARQILLPPDRVASALVVGADLADPASGRLDADALAQRARRMRPSLLVVRAEEFVRALDFAALGSFADRLGARLAVDLGGLAGLVAAGTLPSPVAAADEICAATDRTLRGPRGALLLFRGERAAALTAAVGRPRSACPGAHEVAALAVALREAATPEFRSYALRVRAHARALAAALAERGLRVFAGGTDTHIVRLEFPAGEGRAAADRLARVGLRGEVRSQGSCEWLQLATAAVTTRGLDDEALGELGGAVADVLAPSSASLGAAASRVESLCRRFPLHAGRWSEAD
jgi:glycine hydroxymethyltransferase